MTTPSPSLPSPPISRSCAAAPIRRNWSPPRKDSGSPASRSPTATRSPASCAAMWRRRRPASVMPSAAASSFGDGTPDILAWPTDRAAYGRLCRLLTLGNRRAPKGECHLDLADLLAWGEGLMLGVVPGEQAHPSPLVGAGGAARSAASGEGVGHFPAILAILAEAFPGHVRLMASRLYGAADGRRLAALDRIARHTGVPLLATNDVLYHSPARRPLQDVITAIREHRTLQSAGRLLAKNAERHLKDADEMARLFRDYPDAVAESRVVLERLAFSLDELRYQYPDEPTGDAASPQEALERLTEEGARFRYPGGVPAKVRAHLAHELALIGQLDYAPYFLTVHDIVRYARGERHPRPGPGLGGQLRRLLRPRHHRGRPRALRPSLRALHLARAQRAARHRRRFRARAARGGDAVHLREIRPPPRRAGGDRHHLPHPLGSPRGRQGLRPVGGHHRRALRHHLGLVLGRRARGRHPPRRPRSGRPHHETGDGAVAGADRLPPPPLPACRRLRHDQGPARRDGAGDERRHGGPHHRRMGQGRSRRAAHAEGRRAGARHALLHPPRLRISRPALWRGADPRHHSVRGPGRLPHAAAEPIRSASSRSRAGRR